MTVPLHRSTACVKAIAERGRSWKPDPITAQFRFVIRMAVACHTRGVPYDLTWSREGSLMLVTITATGNIPTPKPLPKGPKLKLVSAWKPTIWDSVYTLEAYHDASLKRMRPGFAIAHSWGLSLVHPSDDGELGGDDNDIRQNWLVTHRASGLCFGLILNFKRATDALLLAASFAVDWTQDVETLKGNPDFRRAGFSVQAAFGTAYEKDKAKPRLAELERAA